MGRRGRDDRRAGRRAPQAGDPGSGAGAERGHHTLEVHSGVVVGVHGGEVLVELGVRMQGVLPERAFDAPPEVGAAYEFTLRGQEDGLWALSLVEEPSQPSWEELQVGSLVPFRVVRRRHGGLEGKIGHVHAFLPRSHTGKQRDPELDELIGRVLTCEVLEVDAQRQRAVVSRRIAERRAKESARQREASGLRPGQIVQGRVTRIEPYGAFVRFGNGLEGLVHVSNLSHERVKDVADAVKLGDRLEAKVLHVNRGGKRIALGVKQVGDSPWKEFARHTHAGAVLEGVVVREMDFGVFVRVVPGVEGLLPRSEMGLGRGEPVRQVAPVGRTLSLRVVELDAQGERLALSLLHADGARIAPEEAQGRADLSALAEELGAAPPGSVLGKELARALRQAARRDAGADEGAA